MPAIRPKNRLAGTISGIKQSVDAMPDLCLGTVTATSTGPSTVTLKLRGSSHTQKASYLASYSPTVNDVVWVLSFGGVHLVLGKQEP